MPNNSAPRTSIIMPVYNTAEQVIRSICSVLAQSDPDFELLILNDQSPDNAHQVIEQFLAENPDSRVRYMLNSVNIGISKTRNHGIELSRGQWFTFLDSDDAFKPNFLQTMHAAVDETIDVVACSHDLVYEDGTTRRRERGKPGTYSGDEALLGLLRDEMTPYVWDKIFRQSAVNQAKFPYVNRTEDAAYVADVYRQVRKVRVIDDSLTLYSVNPRSATWGSVPPIAEIYRFLKYLKEVTGAHQGSDNEQNALATYWVLTFLNGAQSALRLNPENLDTYLRECRNALNLQLILRTYKVRPVFGAAASLLKVSPTLYKMLYGAYIKRTYGL